MFIDVAAYEFGTPHNVVIFEELGNHFKGLVVEEFHELVLSRRFDLEPRRERTARVFSEAVWDPNRHCSQNAALKRHR